MIIYCARNLTNDKMYVGKTTTDLEKRKQRHYGSVHDGSETHFHRALRNDEFEWTILETVSVDSDINDRERFWISKLDTFKNGYNMTAGGDGGLTYKVGTAVYERIKHKLGQSGDKNPGANPEIHQKAQQTIMNNIQTGNYFNSGELHGNFKGKFAEVHKKYKGNPASINSKRVRIDGIEYDSLRSAARAHNICAETVANRCNKLHYIGWDYI